MFVCTYPLSTGQVTEGHLQLPLWAHTSHCCGCCGFLLPTDTHGRAKGLRCCPVCSDEFGSLCLISQTALPELQPKALGIVRPGCAQEEPSQSSARCGLLLRHHPSYSSGSILYLASLVNSLGTGSFTKEDPNRIRDTSAVAQWAGTVLQ